MRSPAAIKWFENGIAIVGYTAEMAAADDAKKRDVKSWRKPKALKLTVSHTVGGCVASRKGATNQAKIAPRCCVGLTGGASKRPAEDIKTRDARKIHTKSPAY